MTEAEIVSDAIRPLIVGAGPAGIRAAQVLVSAGIRPVVVDEARSGGGQIYRQTARARRALRAISTDRRPRRRRPARHFRGGSRDQDRLSGRKPWCGISSDKAARSRSTADRTRRIALQSSDPGHRRNRPRASRSPAGPLPGVFTLGGAQVALKSQGCAIGEKVVFLGSGPLLYLVAWQYVKAGAEVAAVLDTAPFSAKLHLLRGFAAQPAVVLRGFPLCRRTHGARRCRSLRRSSRCRIDGDGASRGHCLARARQGASPRLRRGRVMASSLRSETQLADLAGCRFVFDARDRAWRPERDAAGRTSVSGVYIAGDGAGIAGADAAELAGERAGLALLEDAGLSVDACADRRAGAQARQHRPVP